MAIGESNFERTVATAEAIVGNLCHKEPWLTVFTAARKAGDLDRRNADLTIENAEQRRVAVAFARGEIGRAEFEDRFGR